MTLPNWKNKTMLIVEDDNISLEFLIELLASSNINIISVSNAEQAIRYCKENSEINIVLMDVRLPKMNGEEAMKKIKKERPELPIIAQTAFAMAGDEERYLDSGFDDYISKPIIMTDLITKLIESFNKASQKI